MVNKKIFFLANAKSIHTAKWVDYFVDNQYDVYLATFEFINHTKCKKIYFLSNKTLNSRGGNYHYFLAIGKLSQILREIKPDIINAHYSYSMGLIALLSVKKSKIKSRFSVVCHGSDILATPYPPIFDRLNKYILRHCDKIFAVSYQIKDKLESLGVGVDNLFVGQYGIDLKIENRFKKDIDILSNRVYAPNSRIDFLLETIDSIENKALNIVFVLGNISQKNLEKLVKKFPYINFYKHIEYNLMMNLMHRSKIYISATKSDGTALSLLEAMKCEAIPLVSNIISNRSWILDGVNGYLFDGKKEFKTKLLDLLELNDEKKKDIIKMNHNLLIDKANYKIQMKKIEQFLVE